MSDQAIAGFRLSIQQDRTWSQHDGEGWSYWTECELSLKGPLDEAKLREAIRRVVSSHEILRTIFHRQMGVKVPFQVIRESPDFQWQTVDCSDLNAVSLNEKLRKIVDERTAAFDLEKSPALHAILAKLSPESTASC